MRNSRLYKPSFFIILVVLILLILSTGCSNHVKQVAEQDEISSAVVEQLAENPKQQKESFEKDALIYKQPMVSVEDAQRNAERPLEVLH